MKAFFLKQRGWAGLMTILCGGVLAQAQPVESGDAAWQKVVEVAKPPPIPEEWQRREPSGEELEAFREKQGGLAVEAADQAGAFHREYPEHEHAEEAKLKEQQMLELAVALGRTDVLERLERLEEELLKSDAVDVSDRFLLRQKGVQRRAMMRQEEGMDAVLEELEKGVRELVKDFPDQPQAYQMLLMVASNQEPEAAKKILDDLVSGSGTPPEVKQQAEVLRKQLGMVGQTLDLEFESLEGKPIRMADLRGKVVLIDFWATWCGPCVVELPNVKAAYEELHEEGFQILGISFDHDKARLEAFLEKHEMDWPQYYDGRGWENQIGKRFGIRSIPAMWLVDKKGVVRDLQARDDLAGKVKKLLAEER